MKSAIRLTLELVLAVAVLSSCGPAAETGASTPKANSTTPKVLRVVPASDLTILDPFWTTLAVTRSHGYLVYDTLFATDAKGDIVPQMVDRFSVSEDKKTWTFTLRDGLEFHDGTPVTSADVIASLQRWGQRDTLGQRLLSYVGAWEAIDSKTFRMRLNEPYGLVLESLGKPEANVPFIMPKRIADTPVTKQIVDPTGSGPFIFKMDEWKPGEKIVYVRNPRYKPRTESPSGLAGAKIAKVDRIEWIVIKDPQSQASAIAAGEVEIVVSLGYEQYASLKGNADLQLLDKLPFIYQFVLILNQSQPPFDNPKVRRAAMAAMNQPAFLQTQIGIPELYRTCFSVYPCGTRYSTTKGLDLIANPKMELAQRLLKDSGYKGERVTVLHQTEPVSVAKVPLVAANLLRKVGFNVEVETMDANTFAARRAKKEGWSVFATSWNAPGVIDPATSNLLSGACSLYNGWHCDPELERLRAAFAVAPDLNARKVLAEQVQLQAIENVAYVPLGEYQIVSAARKNIAGVVSAPVFVFWNLDRL